MPLDIPALRARRDAFNAACPPGSQVFILARNTGNRDSIATTRSSAALMGSGEILVWLEGKTGAVNIDRVQPIKGDTE